MDLQVPTSVDDRLRGVPRLLNPVREKALVRSIHLCYTGYFGEKVCRITKIHVCFSAATKATETPAGVQV